MELVMCLLTEESDSSNLNASGAKVGCRKKSGVAAARGEDKLVAGAAQQTRPSRRDKHTASCLRAPALGSRDLLPNPHS